MRDEDEMLRNSARAETAAVGEAGEAFVQFRQRTRVLQRHSF
jgi:hypothetical protein